jgi:hypothetical protein
MATDVTTAPPSVGFDSSRCPDIVRPPLIDRTVQSKDQVGTVSGHVKGPNGSATFSDKMNKHNFLDAKHSALRPATRDDARPKPVVHALAGIEPAPTTPGN